MSDIQPETILDVSLVEDVRCEQASGCSSPASYITFWMKSCEHPKRSLKCDFHASLIRQILHQKGFFYCAHCLLAGRDGVASTFINMLPWG